MRIVLTTLSGKPISSGISSILSRVKDDLDSKSGKAISKALLHSTRNHIRTTYPGSSHWDPSKVNESESSGNSGSIGIDIPGASRAYHDMTILPKNKKHLTIPMHSSAYGKKATDFNDLFVLKKKNGKAFLARNAGNGIEMMYFLATRAFQKKDSRLLPSDEAFADNIFFRLKSFLDKNFKETN